MKVDCAQGNGLPRWISLKEACEYSHIGKDRIKRLAIQGVIKGSPDPDNKRGDWIFDRVSIDAYREAQMSKADAKEKALALMKGVPL
jgi:hypothetical protein